VALKDEVKWEMGCSASNTSRKSSEIFSRQPCPKELLFIMANCITIYLQLTASEIPFHFSITDEEEQL